VRPDPEGRTAVEPRTTARVRRARLRIVSGPDAGKSVPVPDGGIVLGQEADVVLADKSVSRRHAEIRRARGGFVLVDLDSTNGTYVEDVKIGSASLGSGTRFRVGHTEIVFEADEEGLELPEAPPARAVGFVAESPAMRRLAAAVDRFSGSDLTILLEGETGAGKEVVARAIHRLGGRAEGPFVVVDCGALAENLVESELFGHEKGAFTGAHETRTGAFEEADGGTIFLDEIGELPHGLQPKLLRALEAREVRRLGSNKVKSVDVRVIAATNRDLPVEIEEKRFRSDLFFRLSEVRLRIPPLRERPMDVVPLARMFALEVDAGATLRPEAIEALCARSWPGNVRELGNVVRRAVVEAAGRPVDASHIAPPDLRGGSAPGLAVRVDPDLPFEQAKEAVLAEFRRTYLEALVERYAGDLHAVARHTGLHLHSLHRLLRKGRTPPE
jgi:DNA-binding NtrC family response regulator